VQAKRKTHPIHFATAEDDSSLVEVGLPSDFDTFWACEKKLWLTNELLLIALIGIAF